MDRERNLYQGLGQGYLFRVLIGILSLILFIGGSAFTSFANEFSTILSPSPGILLALNNSPRVNIQQKEIEDFLFRNKIRNLTDYAHWLETNTNYREDPIGDDWAPPQEMLRRRIGDCEDYAFLTAEVLKILGYQPHILALAMEDFTHAITVFKDNDQYCIFDNYKLVQTKITSFEDLTQFFILKLNSRYIIEVNFDRDKSRMIYKRS